MLTTGAINSNLNSPLTGNSATPWREICVNGCISVQRRLIKTSSRMLIYNTQKWRLRVKCMELGTAFIKWNTKLCLLLYKFTVYQDSRHIVGNQYVFFKMSWIKLLLYTFFFFFFLQSGCITYSSQIIFLDHGIYICWHFIWGKTRKQANGG